MDTLTRFELRKIIKRKSFLLAVLILLVLLVFVTMINIFSERMPQAAERTATGLGAIRLEKQYDLQHAGALDAKKIAGAIERYHNVRGNPDNMDPKSKVITDEAFAKYEIKDFLILNLIRTAFSPLNEYNHYILDDLTPSDAVHFYDKRTEKVKEYLNMDYTYGNYSAQDKSYFLKLNEKISTPFKLNYKSGWENVLNNASGMILVISFVMCICIAPIFAGEYQSGADAVILSSRYGRSKLIYAKLKASILFTTGLYSLSILSYILITLGVYGWEGWNSNLQILSLLAPFPMTVLEACLWTVVIGYLGCLMMMSITLVLSSRLKSPFPVMIWSIVILFGSMFIPYSKSSRTMNHFIQLLPNKIMDGYDAITHYEVYHLFGHILPRHFVVVGVAFIVTVLLLPVAYRGFKKHQVA
ncbi:ABC transporter permease [Paenibacillus albidus]|uniref:ABC transporter permease subunit n=1 Tax=Paenibacillus albidus TaxID=2041023 RepID=UPI001BE856E3|nr:ABC transporter permease subunit [Paenibacillus albidus]MBT2291994.1 ABC transporter permease [Paenibacillus albidus]